MSLSIKSEPKVEMMAEVRVTASELRSQEGTDSWKDFYMKIRKPIARRYYQTRKSLRNGTWPTSINSFIAIFILSLCLMLWQPDATRTINQFLWNITNAVFDPQGVPWWVRASLVAGMMAVLSFSALVKIRQCTLRILLAYRGWLYEPVKSTSFKTVMWGLLVKMVSGYQPSLYSYQSSLPRLPVPKLHNTLEKLLESLKPLCTEEELEEVRKEAEDFEKGIGPKLQRFLVLKSWWASNYVSDWWEKFIYLARRSPLAINSNYYGMDHGYWTPTKSQTARAATTIHHIINLKRLIDREELPPMTLRNAIPICMAQYRRIFSTVRIPGVETDTLRHYDTKVSRHIVVQAKGLYYTVDVYDSKNQILSPPALKSHFDWILKDAEAQLASGVVPEAARCVAALTALPRPDWAKIRKEHLGTATNRELIKAIEKAIMMVVLSDEEPTSLTQKGKWLLHADGKSIWFDKSLHVVFFKNGQCGLNVEHTMADAPPICHCWEYAMTKDVLERHYTDDGDCMPIRKSFRQGKFSRPARMSWNMTPTLQSEIEKAVQFAQKNNDDLDLVVSDHDKWGKGLIKTWKISPDAFVQAALQLAYYKDSGKFAQTYEASMTRLYSHGRTETVRSCTQELADFVRAMVHDSSSQEEKVGLLRKAAEKHQQLYRDSMIGGGIDRHLFALYVACKGLGYRCPGGGFGPVSDEGYGVGYMLASDHQLFFHVASKHSSSKTCSKRFLHNLFQSLEEMRQLFENESNDKVKAE